MKSKILTMMVLGIVLGCLSLPAIVLTQGMVGRVYNRRTRLVYTGATALSDAIAAAAAGDVLLVAGNITEPTDILFTGFSGTIVGESRAAFRANITVTTCTNAVLDVSDRGGQVTLSNLNVNVPNGCIGVLADGTGAGGGLPLTVQSCRFTGKTAAAVFDGIETSNEFDGPFIFRNNTITGRLDGIWLDGDGATTITATIEGNKITDTTGASGTGNGIAVTDVPAGSAVVVQKNTVDGGGSSGSGIPIGRAQDVIVQKNTVKNYTNATTWGWGINVYDVSLNCQVLRNKVQNNAVGIVVDDSGWPSTGTVVNYNNILNILGNPLTQVGLEFDATGSVTYNLDATNNYWNASSGPNSVASPSPGGACPEASGSTCTGAGGNGTGMPVSAPWGAADCGAAVSEVTTCPYKTVSIFGAGAGGF